MIKGLFLVLLFASFGFGCASPPKHQIVVGMSNIINPVSMSPTVGIGGNRDFSEIGPFTSQAHYIVFSTSDSKSERSKNRFTEDTIKATEGRANRSIKDVEVSFTSVDDFRLLLNIKTFTGAIEGTVMEFEDK